MQDGKTYYFRFSKKCSIVIIACEIIISLLIVIVSLLLSFDILRATDITASLIRFLSFVSYVVIIMGIFSFFNIDSEDKIIITNKDFIHHNKYRKLIIKINNIKKIEYHYIVIRISGIAEGDNKYRVYNINIGCYKNRKYLQKLLKNIKKKKL